MYIESRPERRYNCSFHSNGCVCFSSDVADGATVISGYIFDIKLVASLWHIFDIRLYQVTFDEFISDNRNRCFAGGWGLYSLTKPSRMVVTNDGADGKNARGTAWLEIRSG